MRVKVWAFKVNLKRLLGSLVNDALQQYSEDDSVDENILFNKTKLTLLKKMRHVYTVMKEAKI